MDQKQLIDQWLEEEQSAQIRGWDFSHIAGKYQEEEDLPWDYRETVLRYLTPDSRILDIDTGGGEFLLSLHHPTDKIAATENYPPNVKLCRETLLPMGIDFRQADGSCILPFPDEHFDLVLNRHGDYEPAEIRRVLKPGGVFITQQVGAENDRELVEMLLPEVPPLPFPEQYLHLASERFQRSGFSILRAEEAFRPIRFWDVGALVWFARIIEWEFPGFSVRSCLPCLLKLQERLDQGNSIDGRIHRFLLVAKKE